MYWYPVPLSFIESNTSSFIIRDERSKWYRISLCTDRSFKPIAQFSGHSATRRPTADFEFQSVWIPLHMTWALTKWLHVWWSQMPFESQWSRKLMMLHPFRFACSAISLRIKIWCVVFLSFQYPACSSEICISMCDMSLSNSTIINTFPAWLSSAIVL